MPNYIPEFQGYSGQGAFRYWCQKVLPLVYDDSLSYYELLNKIVVYLNNTIEDVSKAEGNIDSLLTAYTQLQNYVNDYFDNLDVQEQINTKLDEMATDGSLSNLIEPFIPALVTSWLTENVIIPEGGAVTLDPTLTSAVQAAPAKTVGDAIATVDDELAKTIKASDITIEHNNLQGFTSIDDLEANKIYCIASDLLKTDITNLPYEGEVAYIITLQADVDYAQNGVQLYISLNKTYSRRKRLGVWSDWREYANYTDITNALKSVLKYEAFQESDYNTIAEFPMNTSHIVNTAFSDAPETAPYGAVITMRISPNVRLQVFFARTAESTQGIYYRTVNFTDPTNLNVSEWRNLYTASNNLNASGITIEHNNLQGFTSIDDLKANKIYCIASDLLKTDIANLPYEGEIAYIITLQADVDYAQNGVQLYISMSKTYSRRKRLGVWSDWREYANYENVSEMLNFLYADVGNMAAYDFSPFGSGSGTVTNIVPENIPNTNIKTGYTIATDTAPYGIRKQIKILNGETYTVKCWCKGNGILRFNYSGDFIKDINVTDKWEEYEYTFTNIYSDREHYLYISNNSDNTEISVAGISFKVVDKTLKPLYNKVELKGDWEYGTISTNGDASAATDKTRIRSRVFMSFKNAVDNRVEINIPAGYGLNYRIYNEDETFLASVTTITYATEEDVTKIINAYPDKLYKFVIFPVESGVNLNLIDFLKTSISFTYESLEKKKTIRILSIGNSHTRDAVRYLQHILSKNGYLAEVGHYYWGKSTLKQQYDALVSGTGYPETGAYYRCYNDFGIYTSPSTRATLAYHMTLENAIYDKPWDVVVFQQQTNNSAIYESYFSSDFDFNDFISLVKNSIGNDNIKIGIMAVHTRSATFTGDNITPKELEDGIQATTIKVAKEMSQCDYIVNTGLAIKYSRGNEYLRAIGNDMCQTDDWGVHLDYPVPQYIASLTYAMTLCGDSIADDDSYPDSFTDEDIYLGYLGKRYAKYATLNVDNLLDFDNDKIYNTYITKTVNGNPIAIEDGAVNVPLQHLTVGSFNGVIEGTGTPSLSNIYHFIPVTSTDITINGTTHHIEFRTGLYSNGSYDAIEGLTYDNKRFVEFDGTEDWTITFTDENQFPAFYLNVDTYGNAVNNGGQFNILPSLTSLTGDNGAEGGRVYVSGSGNVIVICRFSNLFTNLTDFTNYLKTLKRLGTPLQVLYNLATTQSHIEEKICENSDSGEWNLSTTATNMSAIYRVDTKTYIDNL